MHRSALNARLGRAVVSTELVVLRGSGLFATFQRPSDQIPNRELAPFALRPRRVGSIGSAAHMRHVRTPIHAHPEDLRAAIFLPEQIPERRLGKKHRHCRRLRELS